MRIAFIEPHLHCVGGIRRIVEISNRLSTRGNTVSIFTPMGSACGWLPCTVPVKKLSILHAEAFDVAIFNLAEQFPIMEKARAKLKVFWVLAPEAQYKQAAVPIAALRAGFHFLANSNYTVQYIRQYVQYPKPIPIIPGGVNKQHFFLDPMIKKKWQILYYGSPRPWKGAQLVQAMLAQRNPISFSAMRMQGLNTPQEKMYTLYNAAKVYLSTNLVEGFSFGQLEAMACGCAVVTTDDGGSRDYIIPDYNAIICQRNPTHMYSAVHRVMHDDALRAKLVQNGLATAAEARFDWDRITTTLEQFLRNALNLPKAHK